jgi:hypothetical protein
MSTDMMVESRQQSTPHDSRPNQAQEFMGRLTGDMSGAVAVALSIVGDRLGLFSAISNLGGATADELADAARVDARFVRDWAAALVSAGYLECDGSGRRFSLPAEHAFALAHEGGPFFLGGAFQQLSAMLGRLDELAEGVRSGRGVPQANYGPNLLVGMERLSGTWYAHQLVPRWLGAAPEMTAKLQAGARVADIGCGSGRALIAMAREFPRSAFCGFDQFEPAISRATGNAQAAGVAERVRFEVRDAAGGLPGGFDLVTAFNSLHDFDAPLVALKAIRRGLVADGTLLVLEANASDQLAQNAGPVGTILYGTSALYSTPVSLAAGGQSLGAMGLPERKLRSLCSEAGFGRFARLCEDPFNALYEIRE